MSKHIDLVTLLYRHPLVQLNFQQDMEKWRCARYISSIQVRQQCELGEADMLAAIEHCRCDPYAVGKELAEA